MEPFDLLNAPLKGRNLIEANAGTGKTYAISGLFLRLVVERALSVGEILVMTYTVAATEELKDRIRGTLRRALEALQQDRIDDPFLSSFARRISENFLTETARQRLTAALRNFDEAAVFTIHGFCQRTLQENAFESASTFDAELITDSEKITDAILQDFWRRHFYEAPAELAAYALHVKNNLPGYRAFLQQISGHPDIRVVPDQQAPERELMEREISDYRLEIKRFRESWEESREDVRRQMKSGVLPANSYSAAQTDRFIEELDVFLDSGAPWFPLPKNFERLTANKLATSCKKGCSPPDHPFFTSCQQLAEREANLKGILDRFLLSLKKELLETIRTELPAYKTRRNIVFFDDLLLRLRNALRRHEGDRLAEAIRRKYRAALIDEFQDTDPVQYAILQAVFLRNRLDETDSPPVFLIGDPKQAIYSFRGADIFAYMAAAKQVDVSYTLQENWRSAPSLLAAVNSVFHGHSNPFVYEAIAFADSKAAPAARREQLTLSGFDEKEAAPFQIWLVPENDTGGKGKPLAKDRATPRILEAVAAEMVRLLEAGRQGKAMIGDRRLEAGDLAVLVRTNREARLVQKALWDKRIPAVLNSRENLFDSPDATDMELLLRAIETPNDERRISAALLTPLLGLNIGELYRLKNDERQWEERLRRFRTYHNQCQEEGFMRMMRSLLRTEDVRVRLLSRPDGERRLTNVLHLTEVLHRENLKRNWGIRGLLRWLTEQRSPEKKRSDEHQLRLESDARAVRIVTIHKSKGLEYPVVFCPFVWDGEERQRGNGCICHDGKDNEVLLCDFASPPHPLHQLRACREELAERVRLLYVALTRAKHRCYLVWGHFNEAGGSAPAYLFHDRTSDWNEEQPEEAIAATEAFRKTYRDMNGTDLFRDLERIAASARGSIHIANLPVQSAVRSFEKEAEEQTLSCRDFTREIDRTWRFASFSSLVSGTFIPQEGADREREEEERPAEPPDWKNLPPGTRTGNLLHEFLEHLDFRERDEAILRQRAAPQALSNHGFELQWETALTTISRNVLDLTLSGGVGGTSFRLSDISREDRISELGFYFPLKRLTRDDLRILFQEIAIEAPGTLPDSWDFEMERLTFSPVRGWLRGFIDLVFTVGGRYYLLDWKSNFLGVDPSDYSPSALNDVMVRKHYILQYHLYALALHTYLQRRLPGYCVERHFGGVYYLFLRGIDPARGEETGVYFDRPSEERLIALYEGLIEKNPAKGSRCDVT